MYRDRTKQQCRLSRQSRSPPLVQLDAFATALNDFILFSSSAFGAKPFGQTGTSAFAQNNPNPQNPLFGGAAQASTSAPFGSFGTQSQTQPQGSTQGTSIFGTSLGQNPQQQQPQQTQGTSLFGSSLGSTQQQSGQPSSGLFGQPSSGVNLFGQPAANTQQSGSTLGTSIFGNNQNQQGSLFGQPAANTQQPGSALGTSIFGNTQGQHGSQGGLGQLGANINAASTLGQSTFGNTAAPSQVQATQSAGAFGLGSSNLTGGSLFAKQPSQQP